MNNMKVFRLLIISITYLLFGVLEAYSYYMFKIDAIGIFVFFTLVGFIATFVLELVNSYN